MKDENARIIHDNTFEGEIPSSKIELWRSGVNASLLQSHFTRSQVDILNWSVEAHHFDIFICGHIQATGQTFVNFPSHGGDLNDHFLLIIMLEGGIEGNLGRLALSLEPEDILLIDVLQPLNLKLKERRDTSLAHVMYVVIPRQLLVEIDDTASLHGKVIRRGELLNKLIASHVHQLMAYSIDITATEASRIARPVIDFLISAIKTSVSFGQPLIADTRLLVISRICQYIHQHLQLPGLTAELIGQQYGLSRSSLYRLFEPYGGVPPISAKNASRRRRVCYCTRAIAAGALPRSPIIWHLEPATFNRLFITTYGITPSQARKQRQDI
ncbi:MAG: hypothetical protein ACMX3H_05815 [Sodalis sp. (in: enterobacteria)]|uniref:hypothetical protein n=1 Tax=Sodalis sp. (in: enterobacteria) TaxID=1898979 RepID=UPI0039E6D6CE